MRVTRLLPSFSSSHIAHCKIFLLSSSLLLTASSAQAIRPVMLATVPIIIPAKVLAPLQRQQGVAGASVGNNLASISASVVSTTETSPETSADARVNASADALAGSGVSGDAEPSAVVTTSGTAETDIPPAPMADQTADSAGEKSGPSPEFRDIPAVPAIVPPRREVNKAEVVEVVEVVNAEAVTDPTPPTSAPASTAATAAVGAPVTSSSQPSSATARLSRAELWGKAESSSAVVLARQQLQQAKGELERQQSWQLSLNSGGSWSKTPLKDEMVTDFTSGLRLSYAGLGKDEALFNAQSAYRRAEFRLFRAHLSEWQQRSVAWNELAMAQIRVNIAATELEVAKLKEQVAQSRAEQGAATDLQLRAAKLAMQQAELNFSQAQVALRRARSELGFLGIDNEQAIVGDWTPLPVPTSTTGAGLTLGQREDLLESQLSLENAEMSLERARRDVWPTLNAEGRYAQGQVNLSGTLNSRLAANLSTGYNWQGDGDTPATWSVGVNASVNLDGQAMRQVQLSEQSVASAKLGLERTKKRAVQDVQVKQEALASAIRGLELATESLWAQQEIEKINTERLDKGLINKLDYLQVRMDTMKSMQGVAEARKRVDQATLALWEAVGWRPAEVPKR